VQIGSDVDEAVRLRPEIHNVTSVQGVAEGHQTFTGSLLRCIHVEM
jgi:hypothetical protein